MTERDADIERRLADLEAKVQELSALQDLTLRLLSTRKPLDAVLDQHGATTAQQDAFYELLDEMVLRAKGPVHDRPSQPYYQSQIEHIFHSMREDTGFLALLTDTLRIDRPIYRDLHAYM